MSRRHNWVDSDWGGFSGRGCPSLLAGCLVAGGLVAQGLFLLDEADAVSETIARCSITACSACCCS